MCTKITHLNLKQPTTYNVLYLPYPRFGRPRPNGGSPTPIPEQQTPGLSHITRIMWVIRALVVRRDVGGREQNKEVGSHKTQLPIFC